MAAMPPSTRMDAAKLGRVKDGFRTFLKKFGPLILTGLAAVAEHHWLDHKDDSQDRDATDPPDDRDDSHPIRKLEREIAELKRSISQKARDEEGEGDAGPAPRIREEIVRKRSSPHQEEQSKERGARYRVLADERPRSSSYQPREQHVMSGALGDERRGPNAYRQYRPRPTVQQVQAPQQAEAFVEQMRKREYIQPSHRQHSMHRRRRRHRHSSAAHHISYGAAALAGAVEAIHVADIKGDWVGPKGVRVGTTMAASYAASRSRDRDPGKSRKWEAAVDVGKGLLVSELVHGSARRLEEDEDTARRGRR